MKLSLILQSGPRLEQQVSYTHTHQCYGLCWMCSSDPLFKLDPLYRIPMWLSSAHWIPLERKLINTAKITMLVNTTFEQHKNHVNSNGGGLQIFVECKEHLIK